MFYFYMLYQTLLDVLVCVCVVVGGGGEGGGS